MNKIRYLLRQTLTLVAIVLLTGMAPAPVFADGQTPTTDQSPTTTTSQTTPTDNSDPANGPTGPEAHLFHYNATSGLWENDYYTFDPSTKAMNPKVPLEYTCNPDTRKWDTKIWQYDLTTDGYIQAPVSLDVAPQGAVTHDCPAATPSNDTKQPTTTDPSQSDAQNAGTNTTQKDTTGATLNTTVDSSAGSGDATVNDNHDVNSVGTGNATASTDVINVLQSQSSLSNSGVATFTANIQGNVTGDLVIDPSSMAQPAGSDPNGLNGATINTSTDATINNNITLNAASGNATVADNHNVGTVTTGDATAIADVINMINSIVAANQSFIGTINIYGDYSGNILLPVDSLNALLASASSNGGSSDTSLNADSNYAINNNVNLNATSGTATVADNHSVGSVLTGNAMTNLTILNLTGKQVVTANCLLVFVNVLGHWVGLIMDAPAGTTSAALGGGVSTNAALAGSTTVNGTEKYGINNNITANATTGNASVTDNHAVGSVATGNAAASVSIANLINSNFSISNWFGILFINVFGTWHGNVGVVKKPVVPPITSGSALPGNGGGGDVAQTAKVFAFVPGGQTAKDSGSGLALAPAANTDTGSGGSGGSVVKEASAVLGAAKEAIKPKLNAQQAAATGFNVWTIILVTTGSAGLGFVAVERVRSSLRARYLNKY